MATPRVRGRPVLLVSAVLAVAASVGAGEGASGKFPWTGDSAAVVGEYLAIRGGTDGAPPADAGGEVLASHVRPAGVAGAEVCAGVPKTALALGFDPFPPPLWRSAASLDRSYLTEMRLEPPRMQFPLHYSTGHGVQRGDVYWTPLAQASTNVARVSEGICRITVSGARGVVGSWQVNLNNPGSFEPALTDLGRQQTASIRVERLWSSCIADYDRLTPLYQRVRAWEQGINVGVASLSVVHGPLGLAASVPWEMDKRAYWASMGQRDSLIHGPLSMTSSTLGTLAGELNSSRAFRDAGLARPWVGLAAPGLAIGSGAMSVYETNVRFDRVQAGVDSARALCVTNYDIQRTTSAALQGGLDRVRELQLVSYIRTGTFPSRLDPMGMAGLHMPAMPMTTLTMPGSQFGTFSLPQTYSAPRASVLRQGKFP